MKPTAYYMDAGEYPQRPKSPIEPKEKTAENMRAFADSLDVYENKMELYRDKRKAYDERKAALNQDFKLDLFEEFGVTDHPKADKVFDIAWDLGHADGYDSVSYYFEKLVDIIL